MNAHTRTCLFAILLLGSGAVAHARVTVTLHEVASLSGRYIRLAEVAAVEGGEEESARVAKLFLGPAPKTGRTRRITRTQILQRLEEVGFGHEVQLRGADAVLVQRREVTAPAEAPKEAASAAAADIGAQAQEETVHRVGQAVRRYLIKLLRREDIYVRAEVTDLSRPLPAGIDLLQVRQVTNGRLPGRAQLILDGTDAHGQNRTEIEATVRVSASAQVLLLRRNVRRGEKLRPQDVLVQRYELKPGMAYLPLDAQALAGRQAARSLRAMTPLQEGDLELPAIVFKGQKITVLTSAGGFGVHMKVIAQADARIGELVLVENPSGLAGRNKFMVRVTGFGTAQMPSDQRR